MSGASSQLERPTRGAWIFVATTALFLGGFLVVPVACVLWMALSKGLGPYLTAISSPDALAAARLTAITVAVAVPMNTLFGFAAAWALTKFRLRGKALILALIDLPLAVSPVVAGLVFVFLFGARGLFGPWLAAHDLKVIYGTPGIILATIFVTFPFVARELVPLMEALGNDEELAAASLGAGFWQLIRHVTLPNIRWGLFYGIIVCTARAMGEFGAVSIVSGHIRGETNTIALHVEVLYNEYDQAGAFAVASLLSVVGVLALIAKKLVEWRMSVDGSDS